jgi:hypothetical protein
MTLARTRSLIDEEFVERLRTTKRTLTAQTWRRSRRLLPTSARVMVSNAW